MSKFADDSIVAERIKICSDCDKNKLGFCTGCGCIIKLKVLKKSSCCPIFKWTEFKNIAIIEEK